MMVMCSVEAREMQFRLLLAAPECRLVVWHLFREQALGSSILPTPTRDRATATRGNGEGSQLRLPRFMSHSSSGQDSRPSTCQRGFDSRMGRQKKNAEVRKENVMNCFFCGGVYHPSTGHVWSARVV